MNNHVSNYPLNLKQVSQVSKVSNVSNLLEISFQNVSVFLFVVSNWVFQIADNDPEEEEK